MSDRFDTVLSERAALLAQFQQQFHTGNCPATASTVQRYFETGEIQVARQVPPGFGVINCGVDFKKIKVNNLQAMMLNHAHGYNVVVGAFAEGKEHYYNVVNIRRKVYVVDAFNKPGTISEPNKLKDWLGWADRLEYTRRFVAKIVPLGQAASCR